MKSFEIVIAFSFLFVLTSSLFVSMGLYNIIRPDASTGGMIAGVFIIIIGVLFGLVVSCAALNDCNRD